MKVYINNYRYHWLSPYTILKTVCFWERDDDVFYNLKDAPDHRYSRWINCLEPVCLALQRFLDIVHPKIDYVRIDRWDTWSMDYTLAKIVLPMLRQLKETKHGAPYVDDADVPEELRSTSAPAKENEWDTDANHFKRWDWVLAEMIFAFECKNDNSWEDAFRTGEIDMQSVPCKWDDNGKPTMYQIVDGPKNTYKCDYEGMARVQKRITNGFRLFGKYYENLWD